MVTFDHDSRERTHPEPEAQQPRQVRPAGGDCQTGGPQVSWTIAFIVSLAGVQSGL
jgi:hypothetical protein